MEIYLIRHAEKMDPWKNEKEMSLTERGFLQAELLGERMKDVKLEHIYASDMLRAVQTAEGLNRHIGAPITQHSCLREINTGVREGKTTEEMWELYPEFMEKWVAHKEDVAFPEGESGADVYKRVKPFLDEVAKKDHKKIAIVSHCGVIRCTVCGLLGIPFHNRMNVGRPVEFTSITKLIYEDGRYWVDSFNDYTHIAHTLDDEVFGWER